MSSRFFIVLVSCLFLAFATDAEAKKKKKTQKTGVPNVETIGIPSFDTVFKKARAIERDLIKAEKSVNQKF